MKKIKLLIKIALSVFVLLCIFGVLMIVNAPKIAEAYKKEELPETEPVAETEEGEHSHYWETKMLKNPLCEKEGLRILTCKCGEKIEEIIPAPFHQFEGGSCTKEAKCKFCGTKGEKKPHHYVDARCTSCDKEVKKPIFVLGQILDFDASEEEITTLFGTPTEVLTEGKIRSLVYENGANLTVFQMDGSGLWGVFTMDPEAFFKLGSKVLSLENFTGGKDNNSDATYQNVGGFDAYGFYDKFDSDRYYGMWVHYADVSYHYAQDQNITADFSVQCRLSFYYVNALRARHSLAPLSWSHVAEKVSFEYAKKMATENFFAHDYQCGKRLTQKGLLWQSCGENLSQGYTNAFFVNDAYYNSTDHRANILSETFTQVGMAFYLKNDGTTTLVLGTQTYYN